MARLRAMPRATLIVALQATLILTAVAAFARPATALESGSETASSGDVSAELSFTSDDGDGTISAEIVIERPGIKTGALSVGEDACAELEWIHCGPMGALNEAHESLRVTDLDDDGEPEVVIDIWTGGAHCCSVTEIWRYSNSEYVPSSRNWGNRGYTLRNLDSRGSKEFVAGDERFAYAFTAYAFSGLPIKIMRYARTDFVDVTKRFRPQIRNNARKQWRAYRRWDRESVGRGFAAAWAADQYLLGRRGYATRKLRREARNGNLRGAGSGTAWVQRMDRQLRRWGY